MFLHGEQDTSDTWVELGTMKDLRSSGYRVVAVDLPGKWAEGCEAVQMAVKHARLQPHKHTCSAAGCCVAAIRERTWLTCCRHATNGVGHGKSRRLPYLDNNMRAEFVKAALEFAAKGANITKIGAVLVTPSISG